MKKIILAFAGLLLLIGLYFGYKMFGPGTAFDSRTKFFYIPSGKANKEEILRSLEKDSIVKSVASFEWLATNMKYWKQVKPGKYKIESGNSIFNIVRLLRNGQQSPVNLVITKLRTKEDLASLAGRRLECDSQSVISFLNNDDSLKQFQLDTNTVMTAIFPDTYTFFWNTTPGKVFTKIARQYQAFWTPERVKLARERGLTPQTAYILASIVEEETNKNAEKGNIASVYLNRMNKGMKLGADPTVKFALKDFALKRIYHKHLSVNSPYNTYQVYGLPPGPICTPSAATIKEVLKSPKTDYLFFVAKSDFSGFHTFATTYQDHLRFAHEYQDALNKYMQKSRPATDMLEK